MNRVKVIKEVKGLKIGDILTYNEETGKFNISKIDRDVSETSTSTKSLFISVDRWIVEDNGSEYFTYIDDEGNDIDMQNINYNDIHPKPKESIKEVNKPSTQVVYWRVRNPFERYLLWV